MLISGIVQEATKLAPVLFCWRRHHHEPRPNRPDQLQSAIGGVAKGHLVREVDALGGMMGKLPTPSASSSVCSTPRAAPLCGAPAPSATSNFNRVKMREVLESQPGLHIRQAEVVDLVMENRFSQRAGCPGPSHSGTGETGISPSRPKSHVPLAPAAASLASSSAMAAACWPAPPSSPPAHSSMASFTAAKSATPPAAAANQPPQIVLGSAQST